MAEKYREMGSAGDGMKTASAAAAALADAWRAVRSDADTPTWVWAVFDSASATYQVAGTGRLLESFVAFTAEHQDAVLFGGLRVELPGSPRFLHVLFVGESASGVKRGKAALQKTAAFNAFQGAAGEINASGAGLAGVRDAAAKVLRCAPEDVVVE